MTTAWLFTCMLGLVWSCGDDDAGGDGDDAGSAGSAAGSGGSAAAAGSGGSTAGPAPVVPLGDDVAGDACTSNADCDTGTCATQITGAAILPATAPGGYCTTDCMSDTDCGAGGACVGALANVVRGQCFKTCSADADCRDEYLCSMSFMIAGLTIPSTCRPKPETDQLADGVAGTECTAAADCSGGECLTTSTGLAGQTTLPGGYCSGQCLEDSHCGMGGVCALLPLQGLAGGCYQGCASDADCTRDGYRCREVVTDVYGCDAFPDPLPDDTAGEACSADADCGGEVGTCAQALPVSGLNGALGETVPAPGGYCTQRCADAVDCGAGGVCVTSALGTGRCYAPCATADDCREGYDCEERGGGMAMGDAGVPAGTLVCAPTPPVMPAADAGVDAAAGG